MISNEFNLTAAFCRQSNASILQMEMGDTESRVGNLAEGGIRVGCLRSLTSNGDPCLKVGTVLSGCGGVQAKKRKINNKVLSYRTVGEFGLEGALGGLWSNLLLKAGSALGLNQVAHPVGS